MGVTDGVGGSDFFSGLLENMAAVAAAAPVAAEMPATIAKVVFDMSVSSFLDLKLTR